MTRWRIDLAITVVVGIAIQVAIQTATEPHSRAPGLAGHLLGVAMALPYVVVRRWPVAVNYAVAAILIAYYSAGFPGFPPTVVLIVPGYLAAERGRFRAVLPIPVFFMAAASIVGLREDQSVLDIVNALLPHIALTTAAALLGALVRSRRILAAETAERLRLAAEALRLAGEEREREAQRQVAEERVRIARDLHDTLSHAIATMTVQAGGALQVVEARPDLVREALTAIRTTGKHTLDELRATLGVLRTEASGESAGGEGLDRLPALVEAVRAAGLDVSVELDDPAGALPSTVDQAAYRILQEALTNVLRHAGPEATATVHVRQTGGGLRIEVLDDGTGSQGTQRIGTGNGLRGMRERVAALGGSLEAGPGDGRGFAVRATIPVP